MEAGHDSLTRSTSMGLQIISVERYVAILQPQSIRSNIVYSSDSEEDEDFDEGDE